MYVFLEHVRTSCLPKLNDDNTEPDFLGNLATVTGWGKSSDDSNGKSPVLRYGLLLIKLII